MIEAVTNPLTHVSSFLWIKKTVTTPELGIHSLSACYRANSAWRLVSECRVENVAPKSSYFTLGFDFLDDFQLKFVLLHLNFKNLDDKQLIKKQGSSTITVFATIIKMLEALFLSSLVF